MAKLTFPDGIVVEGQAKEIKEILASAPNPMKKQPKQKQATSKSPIKRKSYQYPLPGEEGKTKTCTGCKIEQPMTSFHMKRGKNGKPGRRSRCSKCVNDYVRSYARKRKAQNTRKQEDPDATKVCRLCNVEKIVSEFHVDNSAKDGRKNECKSCARERARQRHSGEQHDVTEKVAVRVVE